MSLKPATLQFYDDMDEKGRYRVEVCLGTHYGVVDELGTAPVEERAVIWILIAVLFMMIQIVGKLGVTNASTSSTFIAALHEHIQTGLTVCTWVFLWEVVSVLAFRIPEMQVTLAKLRKLPDAEVRFFYEV
ncbi:hypothetical protein [Candidatus Cryosericum septentrionale]|jgi:ABC-type uncharacterized transport system fused permease/ATPase subunit|uniref:Uncharacterized protein n=1 Tax=Candidatus Cryosericum septentrionale TaxID=2290913 RepID=A0A398E4V4_9BACT|nr:hypothetical protein [Candidatus Cryosericum septentrionale]RIE17651.1 hypothetical protein SMC1_00265 [Candidatus Cryosericum septentrionale]